jgi:hypothetical protein
MFFRIIFFVFYFDDDSSPPLPLLLPQPGLDVCLTFAPTASRTWQSDKWGGHTQYLDSEEALLAFDPLPNQLSLVFRGEPGAFKYASIVESKSCSDADFIE